MAEVAVLQTKGMDKGNSTVWIGFMDIVPVIGAVKESVEFVLALYEGNSEEIKKKENALDNIVKQLTQRGYKPAAATTFSNVKEVPKGKIIEHVNKVSKNQNLSQTQKQARKRKVEEIQKDMQEKLSQISRQYPEELTEQLTRSDRGEHVFNNNILRFHSNVLREFIKKYNIHSLQEYESKEQTLNKLGKHTLSQKTAEEIQTNMVAHFDSDEFYVNANAILYGYYSKDLREAILNVLDLEKDTVDTASKDRVTIIINNMNNCQIYVDELAKEKWISNNKRRERNRFEEVRRGVVQMYSTDRGLKWCNDIRAVVKPLFKSQ